MFEGFPGLSSRQDTLAVDISNYARIVVVGITPTADAITETGPEVQHVESWLGIPGYEGLYEVSDTGKVLSVKRGKLLKQRLDRHGYPTLRLCRDGKPKTWTVHTIVAYAFMGPRPEGADICHNDGDRKNCHAQNLRYGSRSDNIMDEVKHGTHLNSSKTHCPQGHEYSVRNTMIRKRASTGGISRDCRACDRERQARRRRNRARR